MVGIGKSVEQGRKKQGGKCRAQRFKEGGKVEKNVEKQVDLWDGGDVWRLVKYGGLQYVVNTRKNGIYKAKKSRKKGHLEKVLRKNRITTNKYQLRININKVSRETIPV